MTNKVKPFYIEITDNMTPQMVQDAFDKCVDAGADAEECIADTNKKHNYQDAYHETFNYFGVSDYNETYLADDHCNYGELAQEITLDQLDKWLWLEVEWKAGDECVYKGNGAVVIGWHPSHPVVIIDSDEFGLESCSACELSKPETPEQKVERERLEAIDSMFIELNLGEERELNEDDRESIHWKSCEVAYDAGYRKQ